MRIHAMTPLRGRTRPCPMGHHSMHMDRRAIFASERDLNLLSGMGEDCALTIRRIKMPNPARRTKHLP